MGNLEKEQQLGMTLGKANHILTRRIIFELVKETKRNICFRCGEEIKTEDDLSKDHIKDWLHSDKPEELFFDFKNIAFSHKACNKRQLQNRKTYATIGYKGVFEETDRKKKFCAVIWIDGRKKNIGRFYSAEEAAEAYDDFCLKQFGKDAITNKKLGFL